MVHDGLPSIAIETPIAHAVNNDHVNAWVELSGSKYRV